MRSSQRDATRTFLIVSVPFDCLIVETMVLVDLLEICSLSAKAEVLLLF